MPVKDQTCHQESKLAIREAFFFSVLDLGCQQEWPGLKVGLPTSEDPDVTLVFLLQMM